METTQSPTLETVEEDMTNASSIENEDIETSSTSSNDSEECSFPVARIRENTISHQPNIVKLVPAKTADHLNSSLNEGKDCRGENSNSSSGIPNSAKDFAMPVLLISPESDPYYFESSAENSLRSEIISCEAMVKKYARKYKLLQCQNRKQKAKLAKLQSIVDELDKIRPPIDGVSEQVSSEEDDIYGDLLRLQKEKENLDS